MIRCLERYARFDFSPKDKKGDVNEACKKTRRVM